MVKRDEPEQVGANTLPNPAPAFPPDETIPGVIPSKRARWESTTPTAAAVAAASPFPSHPVTVMANAQAVAAALSAARANTVLTASSMTLPPPQQGPPAPAASGSKPGVTSDALERMKANLAASKARIEALKQSKAAQVRARPGSQRHALVTIEAQSSIQQNHHTIVHIISHDLSKTETFTEIYKFTGQDGESQL